MARALLRVAALVVVAGRRVPGAHMHMMCESDGTCHEHATVASPRTETTNYRQDEALWFHFHAQLVEEAAAWAPSRTPLVLVGDSITESWRGTSYGQPTARATGTPEVLAATFGQRFDPMVLAISGDQT